MNQRVVIISAGASGIGLAMAKAFMANDYLVHNCDADPPRWSNSSVTTPKHQPRSPMCH